jgi:hypothetical protein
MHRRFLTTSSVPGSSTWYPGRVMQAAPLLSTTLKLTLPLVLPSPSFNNILNTTDNVMAINNILTTAATSTYGMTTMPQACGTCEGLARFDGTKLRHCTGCRQILYCSVNCQKQDWPRHKSDCRRARGITPINSAASSPPAQSPTSLPPSEVASPIDVTSLEPMILDSHTISISGDMDMNMDSDQCAMLTAPSSTAFSSLPHTHLKSANIASIPAA